MDSIFTLYFNNLPYVVQIITILGLLMLFIGFIASDTLPVRIMVLIGTFLLLIMAVVTKSSIFITMLVIHCLVNGIQIIRLFLERSSYGMPDDLRVIYEDVFFNMRPKDFLTLIKMGERVTTQKEKTEYLFHAGDTKDVLLLILKGRAVIEVHGKKQAELSTNSFIGEMHYLTKRPMSADVRIVDDLTYIRWYHEQLDRFKMKNPDRFASFLSVLSLDLVDKLQSTNIGSEENS